MSVQDWHLAGCPCERQQLTHGTRRESIDYTTGTITAEDPLRRLLFDKDCGFSHTLHVLQERRRRYEHPEAERDRVPPSGKAELPL